MIAKIIDNKIVIPTMSEQTKIIVTNPTEEQIKFLLGYKELIENIPEYDPDKQLLIDGDPTEDDNTVYRNFTVEDIPVEGGEAL